MSQKLNPCALTVAIITASLLVAADNPKAAPTFPPLPRAVTSFGAAIVDNALYVYGGHQGRAHAYYQEAQANTLWKLDLAGSSKAPAKWEALGNGPRLQGLAMVGHEGRLYRLGGFTAKNKDGEEQDLWSQAQVAVYNIESKTWSDLPPLPQPRSSFDAVVMDGFIYVVGGWQLRGGEKELWHKSAFAMDLKQDSPQWKSLPTPPFRRRALAVAAFDGKVYAIGGMQPNDKTTTRVDVLDVRHGVWSRGPSLQGKDMEGFGASAFATGGRLYVTTYAGNLQRLSEDGQSWEIIDTVKRARFFHRMLPFTSNSMLSVGGANMETGKFEEIDVIRVDVPSISTGKTTNLPPQESGPPAKQAAGAAVWQGFQNGGKLSLDAPAPLKWSPETVTWSTKLAGYGQSSPVVMDDLAYVTSVSGDMKQNLHVQAISVETGKEIWRYDGKNSTPEKNTSYVSRAAPSPVCDINGVIALFEGGNVVSLDSAGKVRWTRDLVKDYGPITARHGLAASIEQGTTLLSADGAASSIFVWIEREKSPYLVALKKDTGQTLWKVEGLGGTSWSSPRLVPVGDSHHLVLSGNEKVVGFDPVTGTRLWELGGVSGNTSATPVPLGDGKFLLGASEGRGEAGGGNAAASNGVIAIQRKDDQFEAKFIWQARKATSSFGSPIEHRGLVYFVNRVGVVYCLDAKTGEQRYAERSDGSIWATPLAAEEYIYLFGRNGQTTVIAAGPDFKKLESNALWESKSAAAKSPPGFGMGGPVLYAAAPTKKGDLLLRRGDVLYAVSK